MSNELSAIKQTDAVIIGAGPVGLFAIFELGLLDIKADVIDILAEPGGQCIELYPEKPIYDIPGMPVTTGKELVDNLVKQAAPFKPTYHFNQLVTSVVKLADGSFNIETDYGDGGQGGQLFNAKAVIIAAGGGSFQPRRLNVDINVNYEGKCLFYAVKDREALRNKKILIVGGGDSALDWAIDLCPIADSLTLLHRRNSFRAAPASVNKMHELINRQQMDMAIGEIGEIIGDDNSITAVKIKNSDQIIQCDVILPFLGLVMKTGPLTDWDINIENNLIPVDTAAFQTNIPGIFAIGDINTYPGKLKLILSGFHESALMAQAVYKLAYPDKRLVFQYTTSSSRLQKKLGVR